MNRDVIETIAHRLKSWSDAYPTDIFHPLSKEEINTVHKVFPGVLDRQAAAMARHITKQMHEMGSELEQALEPYDPSGD